MNQVECGRNAVWGGCEESLINSHFQSVIPLVHAADCMPLAEVGPTERPTHCVPAPVDRLIAIVC